MAAGAHAVKRRERIATIIAMLKPDGHRYSAHDAEFFEREAVAATARSI